jgi:hypothetical protein
MPNLDLLDSTAKIYNEKTLIRPSEVKYGILNPAPAGLMPICLA